MNIFILYHSEQREKMICDMIANKVKEVNPDVDITVDNVGLVFDICFEKKPDVIFTVPIRDEHMAVMMTAVKLIYGCKIICLTTEGVENFDNEEMINLRIGEYPFSERLIDYYYYWGPLPTRLFRKALLDEKRISEADRVGTSGYVFYEKEAVEKYIGTDHPILKQAENFYKKYGKLVLAVTGFVYYTDIIEERLGCSSFPPYNTKEEYDEHVKMLRHLDDMNVQYREHYIDALCEIAEKHPDKGIIVKYHPFEIGVMRDHNINPYKRLEKYDNIMIVKEAFPIGILYKYVDLFFHYGSTTGVETYIHRVPSVLLSKKCHENIDEKYGYLYGDALFQSTKTIQVDDIEEVLDIVESGLEFKIIPELDKYIYDVFNFRLSEEYSPTKVMADEILAGKTVQLLDKKDRAVNKALKSNDILEYRVFYYKKIIKGLSEGKWRTVTAAFRNANVLLPNMITFAKDIVAQGKLSLTKNKG